MQELHEDHGAGTFYNSVAPALYAASDTVSLLLLREYGAVFVTRSPAVPPPVIVFDGESSVRQFQASVRSRTEMIGGFEITLQAAAMANLVAAKKAAVEAGRDINPRGSDSGTRTYDETVQLWNSRVEPALRHWVSKRLLDPDNADRIRRLSPFEQVPEVLQLESNGLFFAKDLSKSIIYSVAPPGASQHLAMLAFDVEEFGDPIVRDLLAEHGWHQTVTSDLPHFTYLGAGTDELPRLGLRKVHNADQIFWVPAIP